MTEQARPPRPRRDLIARNIEGDQAILDPTTGTLHVLNPTSMAIWEACDGETTVDEIADALVALTGAEPDEALAQVRETLDRFAAEGLLV